LPPGEDTPGFQNNYKRRS